MNLVIRDNNKPINILTGIDYWLDNLMCNVPELVMCFHVNGIVQVTHTHTHTHTHTVLTIPTFPSLSLSLPLMLIINSLMMS